MWKLSVLTRIVLEIAEYGINKNYPMKMELMKGNSLDLSDQNPPVKSYKTPFKNRITLINSINALSSFLGIFSSSVLVSCLIPWSCVILVFGTIGCEECCNHKVLVGYCLEKVSLREKCNNSSLGLINHPFYFTYPSQL